MLTKASIGFYAKARVRAWGFRVYVTSIGEPTEELLLATSIRCSSSERANCKAPHALGIRCRPLKPYVAFTTTLVSMVFQCNVCNVYKPLGHRIKTMVERLLCGWNRPQSVTHIRVFGGLRMGLNQTLRTLKSTSLTLALKAFMRNG